MKRRLSPNFRPDYRPCDIDAQIAAVETELYYFEEAAKANKVHPNVVPSRRNGLWSAIYTLRQRKLEEEKGVHSAAA